ncbi:hypothetical protein [Thermofilum pendens]|uniref:Uncharacterized protein n=1 Tax=Thermofilum pendens (strain DSM 2475 / Hrk 5) TaxID=368408 RepID=A1RYT5_THEPD|nr:hypothetical protein [Thermofilum pendens]ABL78365.1 hypothetical protein Tpen_0965 [Thermofilum pendens Hrk 5]
MSPVVNVAKLDGFLVCLPAPGRMLPGVVKASSVSLDGVRLEAPPGGELLVAPRHLEVRGGRRGLRVEIRGREPFAVGLARVSQGYYVLAPLGGSECWKAFSMGLGEGFGLMEFIYPLGVKNTVV